MTPRVQLRPLAVAGALGVMSVVAWLFLRHAGASYDLEYHLAWGRGLVHGDLPDFTEAGAPTEHPLTLLASALAELVPGVGQHQLLHGSAYLAYAVLVLCVALIGAELFSWPAGIIAGAVVAVSPPMAANTALAFQDVSATAFVLLALLLGVRRPDQPARVLAVLTLGGLLRPEVWGLAGAYWLFLLPDRTNAERVRLGLLAAAAPLIWAALDLIVTGEPLYSFTATKSGAAEAHRTTGIAQAPDHLVTNLRRTLEKVVLVGGAGGAVAAALFAGPLRAWQRSDHTLPRTTLLAFATLVLSCLGFLVLGAGELSLLERYVFTPAALLALFFGFAVTAAWHARQRVLVVGAAICGAIGLASAVYLVPRQFDTTRGTLAFLDDQYRGTHGLETLVDDPDARAVLDACPAIAVSSYRTRPFLANDLGRAPASLVLADTPAGLPARGALVVPADRRVRDVLLNIGVADGPLASPPPGFRRVAGNAAWSVLARGCSGPS